MPTSMYPRGVEKNPGTLVDFKELTLGQRVESNHPNIETYNGGLEHDVRIPAARFQTVKDNLGTYILCMYVCLYVRR